MASIAAFVYFWSSAYVVSGGCATDTLYPSFLRMLATASQPEPSANAPCTRTTFLICCFTTILLCGRNPLRSFDFRCRTLSHQNAPLLSYGRDAHLTYNVNNNYWLLADLCGGGSLFDELGCFLRVRHVGHMARLHFDCLGLGALRHHALLFRIYRSVFGCHHVKSGLVLPGGILDQMGERVSRNRHLCYSHELRLIPWDVRCEVGHEMRLVYPPKPVAVGIERLGGLRHSRFDRRTALTFIKRKSGNINKRRNVWMIAGLGDNRSTVAVSDQDDRAVHSVDCGLRVFLVVGVGSLGVLHHRHLVAIMLEDVGNPLPARSICESSMHQNYILNMLSHDYSPLH